MKKTKQDTNLCPNCGAEVEKEIAIKVTDVYGFTKADCASCRKQIAQEILSEIETNSTSNVDVSIYGLFINASKWQQLKERWLK